jgi:hypothetical protein
LFQPEAPDNDDGAAAEAMAEIEPSSIEETAEAHALAFTLRKNAEADVETKIDEA